MSLTSKKSKLAGALTAGLIFLAACDAGDYAITAEEQAAAAQAAPLNFDREMTFLTRSCISALEARSPGGPDLTTFGYSKRVDGSFSKQGPQVSSPQTRDLVSLKYDNRRSYLTCTLKAWGLLATRDARGPQPEEIALIERSLNALRSAGYREVTPAGSRPGNARVFVKGATKIEVLAKGVSSRGSRSLVIDLWIAKA